MATERGEESVMNPTTDHAPGQQGDARGGEPAESLSIAPLNGATGGRLVFSAGATRVILQGDPALADLYRARFVQQMPSVHLDYAPAGTPLAAGAGQHKVTIHYRHSTLADWFAFGREPLAAITLNGSIPWEIEFHSGVSHLQADLRRLPLRSLDLSDSSTVWVRLPPPTGHVYLYVNGSASDVTILRPAPIALRVQIAGSASQVRIDERYFGAVANGLHWQTPTFDATPDHYDIRFGGSVSNVTISGAEAP